jgi:glycosyltransferase involved in cell wall biosynthesis
MKNILLTLILILLNFIYINSNIEIISNGFYNIKPLNIALHAQVDPIHKKIVGSVITTDGLKSAFKRRNEVNKVETFYPFSYNNFFDTKWDLIIIEGWFMMINEFILISRTKFPNVVIIFFCLDPIFPGMNEVISFDVDGYFTNSRIIEKQLSLILPTQYIRLAANPDIMKPNTNITKKWGAIYVGAGGGMIKYKPKLLKVLQTAIPYGLRLYGSNWDEVPSMKDVWLGPLPKDELDMAYSSAHIIIASATEEQTKYGMVNNRIFEALSCGSAVLSDYSDAVKELAGDVLFLAKDSYEVDNIIKNILSNQEIAKDYSKRSREFIIQKHTWEHRSVEIMDFYWNNKNQFDINHLKISNRRNKPQMAWIVSESLKNHLDYIFIIEKISSTIISKEFFIHYFSEIEWKNEFAIDIDNNNTLFISQFDVITIVSTPFDDLDLFTRINIPSEVIVNGSTNKLQKCVLYAIGFDSSLLKKQNLQEKILNNKIDSYNIKNEIFLSSIFTLNYYDVILFRDFYEIILFRDAGVVIDNLRIQHSFGVVDNIDMNLISNIHQDEILVVCFINYIHLCTISNRMKIISKMNSSYTLLLLGGNWSQWVDGINNEFIIIMGNLYRTIHVADMRTGIASKIISSITGTIYILHDNYIDNINEISSNNDGETDPVIINTVNNIIWPIIYACIRNNKLSSHVGDYYLRVHLPKSNNQLMNLFQEDCENWDYNYLKSSISTGFIRLYGLANSLSTLNFNIYKENNNNKIYNINETVIKLENVYSKFVVGKDGKCCIENNDYPLICIIRPFDFFIITIQTNELSCGKIESLNPLCIYNDLYSKIIPLNFTLHGNIFNDEIYKIQYYFKIFYYYNIIEGISNLYIKEILYQKYDHNYPDINTNWNNYNIAGKRNFDDDIILKNSAYYISINL